MNWSREIGILIGVLLVSTILCLDRMSQESGRVRSRTTSLAVWACYFLHLGILVAVAVHPVWPLPISAFAGAIPGSLFMSFGVTLFAFGTFAFGSLRRMSGRETQHLVTDGIYVWTRNPQNVGWIAVQLGISLIGRSTLALVMTGVFTVGFLVYTRFEERHLRAIFGDEYLAYQQSSHRIFGLPRKRKSEKSCTRSLPRAIADSPRSYGQVSPASVNGHRRVG